MTCALGCHSPAIGIANLHGAPATPNAGHSGVYPLCRYHVTELTEGRWSNVIVDGIEYLPTEESK